MREADQSGVMGYSATEQAMADANALPDLTLDLFQGGDVRWRAIAGFLRDICLPRAHAGEVR